VAQFLNILVPVILNIFPPKQTGNVNVCGAGCERIFYNYKWYYVEEVLIPLSHKFLSLN
jgi:hypothetical protein